MRDAGQRGRRRHDLADGVELQSEFLAGDVEGDQLTTVLERPAPHQWRRRLLCPTVRVRVVRSRATKAASSRLFRSRILATSDPPPSWKAPDRLSPGSLASAAWRVSMVAASTLTKASTESTTIPTGAAPCKYDRASGLISIDISLTQEAPQAGDGDDSAAKVRQP